MEPNVSSPKTELDVLDSLPDPRLSPLTNPRLEKNLGRWAKVYYTTPPEQRDQAVRDLVRELEEQAPSEPIPDQSNRNGSHATADPHADKDLPAEHPHFCILCGTDLDRKKEADASHDEPSLPSPPLPAPVFGDRSDLFGIEGDRGLDDPNPEKPRRRKHIVLVLAACVLVAVWSLGRIRLAPALENLSMTFPPIMSPDPPVIIINQPKPAPPPSRVVPTKKVVPAMPHKPTAGKPVECGMDHLRSCGVEELYRKTMALAVGIDSRYLAYDKRIEQLTRDARRHASRQGQTRSRQANYSAQAWERQQIESYRAHDREVARKYRAELIRRQTAAKAQRNMPAMYDNPRSCLDLHYIAQDLRRLAAKLPQAPRAVVRRAASVSKTR